MSRIREALLKAQREGAANLPRNSVVLSADHVNPERSPLQKADSPGVGPTTPHLAQAPEPLAYIRLEELKKRCVRGGWDPELNNLVFSDSDTSSPAAEQFRTLRSRISRLGENQPLRRVLITSAVPGEGKSFVAANLALAMVRQQGRRVLLIDADLRSSTLHNALGVADSPGLSEYLQGQVDEFAVIQGNHRNDLFFIPGGKRVTNPVELLSDVRFKDLLDRMAAVFDWILVDSPPTLPVTDASILAEFCEGVLLVVRAGSTSAEFVQRACREYRERRLLGVVLNRAEDTAAYGSYSYYGDHKKQAR